MLQQMDLGLVLLDQDKTVLAVNDWLQEHAAPFPGDVGEQDIAAEAVAGRAFLDLFPCQKNGQLEKSIYTALQHRIRSVLSPDVNLAPLPLRTPAEEDPERPPVTHIIKVLPVAGPAGEPHCLLQVSRQAPASIREALLYEQTRNMMAVTEKLRLTKEMAERANRAKSEFLALTSHELRTPLNAIIGFADILDDELLGPHAVPQYREYSRDIAEAGRHLLNVINDILDLSKIEADKFQLNEELVDVVEIIRSVVNMVNGMPNRAALDLISDYPDDLPDLRADGRSLKQMLLNLVSNAIKFTPATGTIRIRAHMAPTGEMVLSVRDSGVGIAAADLKHILEPFAQAAPHMNRDAGGTGLGLTLVKKMVELHGGRLHLDSEPGHGTHVELIFPKIRVQEVQDRRPA